MTYIGIAEEAEEILNSVSTMNLAVLEDTLDRIDELYENLEILAETDESDDDTDYQEAASMLQDAKHAIESELDSFYEDEEDDY